MSKIHDLKCWPEFFQAIKRGDKTFEIRLDDRDYQVGDTLYQREWCPLSQKYTGDELSMEVTYKMKGGQFGLPDNHCILGFKSPVLAGEIKRLEAEKSSTAKTLTHLSANNEALTDENKELRARIAELEQVSKNDSWSIVEKTGLIEKQAERIAALETALGLPEGCDVFELERAQKEGATPGYGEILNYVETRQNQHCFENKQLGMRVWVNDVGYQPGVGRLYCIKDGGK